MVVFEINKEEKELINEIKQGFGNCEVVDKDALDGNDIIQLFVPIISILAPSISQTVQRYFDNSRVTIKYNGIEITTMGYDKAIKLLSDILERDSKLNNED